jgi:hypothetical protein
MWKPKNALVFAFHHARQTEISDFANVVLANENVAGRQV